MTLDGWTKDMDKSMRTNNKQTVKIVPALLFCVITLLQPVPEACADISAQDKEVIEAVEKVAPTVEEIARKLWSLSKVSLLEIKSSAYLKDLLKNNGFTITSEDNRRRSHSLYRGIRNRRAETRHPARV